MKNTYTIEKRGYSYAPWRLIDAATGKEIEAEYPHPDPELPPFMRPVCGDTKQSVVEALASIAWRFVNRTQPVAQLEDIISIPEAAALRNLDPDRVRDWCSRGIVECRDLGGTWAIYRPSFHRVADDPPNPGRRPRVKVEGDQRETNR